MKTKINIPNLFVIMSLLAAAAVSWAIENPNVGSPFQQRNAPPRSGQPQRFISTPNQNTYGRSSNDIVTGNVGGGKHFRGVVPYGSPYYSGTYSTSLGSRSVSQFLRRSQSPITNDRNPGKQQSFYDPSRTVSAMRRPDGAVGLKPPETTSQGKSRQFVIPTQAYFTESLPKQRPLSSNNMDLEQILARQEQLREEAQATTTDELTKRKNFFDITLLREADKEPQEEDKEPPKTEPKLRPEEQLLIDMQREEAEAMDEPKTAPAEDTTEKPDGKRDWGSPKSDLLPELDPDTLNSAEGREILGKHTTFESLAKHKFAAYMDAAERFVQEAQFYKAADTYALAAVWRPQDARAHLGQSFSLLAAGEYMSSAYYLSRAFELDPAVPKKEFDLSDFIGDRDIFENRVLEMTTWQERSNSGELAFLLAYVSYQDNKSVRAAEAIKKAKQTMPDSQSVMILNRMINSELDTQ